MQAFIINPVTEKMINVIEIGTFTDSNGRERIEVVTTGEITGGIRYSVPKENIYYSN